jgi:uncharacterized protein (DUF2236 family)
MRSRMGRLVADGTVRVTPTARRLAPSVLYPTRFPPRVAWDAAHLVSLSVMEPSIRDAYGIAWSPARERVMRGAAAMSRRLLPHLPRALRDVPQARSAERRVRAAPAPRW